MIDSAMLRRLMTQCGMERDVIDTKSMRLATEIFTAGQKEAREACADRLRINSPDLLLLAGEMSAQELRTVQAVLAHMARAIRGRDEKN